MTRSAAIIGHTVKRELRRPAWRRRSPGTARTDKHGRIFAALRACAADYPDIARAVKVISADEDNHLAYCHEELLRLAAARHAPVIAATLVVEVRGQHRGDDQAEQAVDQCGFQHCGQQPGVDRGSPAIGWLCSRAPAALVRRL